jgi:hypothetical protein
MASSVLVIANERDIHTRAVCSALRRDHGIEAVVIDMGAVVSGPCAYRQDGGGTVRTAGDVELSDIRAVWCRRPSPAVIPPGVDPAEQVFRQAECDALVQGLLWSLDCAWFNHPGAQHVAANKLVQLAAARDAGLCVPDTLVTNDPESAAEFIAARRGPTVYKRTGLGTEFTETKLVLAADLSRLDGIRFAPTTFQQYIEGRCDVRVVWMAGHTWAVRIDSQAGAGWLDSRLDNTVAFTALDLEPEVLDPLGRMMAKLELTFGVIDLRVCAADGRTYFLEVNPQGQFAYLEIKSGVPIVRGVAAVLTETGGGGGRHIAPVVGPAPNRSPCRG